MATKKGVWNIQQVRDKQLQSLWDYAGAASEALRLFMWGGNPSGTLGQNNNGQWSAYLTAQSSPIQITGGGTTWSKYHTGRDYTYAINTDDELWAWGNNQFGWLGQNEGGSPATQYSSPVQIPGTTWSTLASNYNATGCVRSDNTLWMWGNNGQGNLGLSETPGLKRSSPTQVPGTNWSTNEDHFSGAYYHMLSIKTDGTAWLWGGGQYGQLGQNSISPGGISSPIQIPGTTWSGIAGCFNASYAVKTNGTLWAWGINDQGQLGQNDKTQRSSPVQIPGTTWSKVRTNIHSAYALKTDGTLWAWGGNYQGVLGQNEYNVKYSSPVQIPGTTWNNVDGTGSTTMATKTDGTLWMWGDNQAGQHGVNDRGGYDGLYGPLLARSSPVQVPGWWSMSGVSLASVPSVTVGAIKI